LSQNFKISKILKKIAFLTHFAFRGGGTTSPRYDSAQNIRMPNAKQGMGQRQSPGRKPKLR